MLPSDEESITLDRLDRQIIHALTYDGRAPLSRIAEALGRSEQTVARRYRRLRETGIVRIIAMRQTDRLGRGWFVRMQIKPGSVVAFAELIARRPDVSWVSIITGGSEVLCSMRPRSLEERDRVLLDRLPRTAQITGLTTAAILHPFITETSEWGAFGDPLTPAQIRALVGDGLGSRGRGHQSEGAAPDPEDEPLLDLLRIDGRMTYAELAAQTGSTPTHVARRLDALLRSGTAYLDLEIAFQLLGFRVPAIVWATVAPGQLDAVGRAVAEHEETSFVAAISGPSNLFVSVICRDTDHLYRYLTDTLGAVEGIEHLESSPVLRQVKQAGTLMEGVRLPDPTATVA